MNELITINNDIKEYVAGFNPESFKDDEVCSCKNDIDSIIGYLKKIKTKVDTNIKDRNIVEAGLWDITLKEIETTRLDQKKVKQVLIDNGGLELFQTKTISQRLSIKINKDRALDRLKNDRSN